MDHSRRGHVFWRVVLVSIVASSVGFHLFVGPADAQTENPRQDRERLIERILQNAPEADTDGDGTLSEAELRAFMRERRAAREGDSGDRRERGGQRATPTHSDLVYGEHDRHRLDLYLPPNAEAPTPMVVFYHGGGFVGGDKRMVSPQFVQDMNAHGIAVAAVNYRYCTTDPLPAAMHDGARAIQHLRLNAESLGLDPERVAVIGGSAGAGIALWIALHDDLADPDSTNPVARQSTRVTCARVTQAQVSYDPRFWVELGLERALAHRDWPEMYGYPADTAYDDPRVAAAAVESAPITHLTADDPPLRFDYRSPSTLDEDTPMRDLIHHPNQAFAMRDACEPLGVPCIVVFPDGPPETESAEAYLIRHLTQP